MSASATPTTVGPSIEEREGRQRHDLRRGQERERREHLADPDRAPVGRREHEPVQHALFPLGDERAAETEQRSEDDRHPEQSERGSLRRVGRQSEVEDDQHAHDEEQHRRQRVARPELEEQILARERRSVSEVAPHASASRPGFSGSSRAAS